MGVGARLAEERGRWAQEWHATDLDLESERLLDHLVPGEELRTAVPGLRVREPQRPDPVLIGVTDRRIVVVGPGMAAGGRDIGVADAVAIDPLDRCAPCTVRFRLAASSAVVDVELDPFALTQLREQVDVREG